MYSALVGGPGTRETERERRRLVRGSAEVNTAARSVPWSVGRKGSEGDVLGKAHARDGGL